MAAAECSCGSELEVAETSLGRAFPCPFCKRPLRAVVATPSDEPFTARLTITAGPDRVGEQLLLGGEGAIGVGKMPTTPIRFGTPLVSRLHCELRRTPAGGWIAVDRNSASGLFVNGLRISSRTLQGGDVVRIGEYELRFDPSEKFTPAPMEPGDGPDTLYDVGAAKPAVRGVKTVPPPQCPNCHKKLLIGAKICVDCGIDLETGEPLAVSDELDEEEVATRAEAWLAPVSRIVPAGLFPITFTPAGSNKPHATWAIAIAIIMSSAMLYAYLVGNDRPDPRALNLQLWTGSRQATDEKGVHLRETLRRHYRDMATTRAASGVLSPDAARQADRIANTEAAEMLGAPEGVAFRWHQPLTYAFLHRGLVGIALALFFLLVFGLRVNELVGNGRMLVLFALLAAGPALVERMAHRQDALAAVFGASAAVTGLAGMYAVFFPLQRVYGTAWVRLGSWLRFRTLATRGLWLVAAWIAVADLFPILFKSEERVPHWAHASAFALGVAAAVALLLTRQVRTGGGDIVSMALGRPRPAAVSRGADAMPV